MINLCELSFFNEISIVYLYFKKRELDNNEVFFFGVNCKE